MSLDKYFDERMYFVSDFDLNDSETYYNSEMNIFKSIPPNNSTFINKTYEEIIKILPICDYLKKKNYKVGINLMQISEINLSKIKEVAKMIHNSSADIFYIADSLGALDEEKLLNVSILGPGFINTKLHKKKKEKIYSTKKINKIKKVVKCIGWILNQSKNIVSGRNFIFIR